MAAAAAKPTFPLPRGYFGDTPLTKPQVARYRAIAQAQVDAALQTEQEVVHNKQRFVDTSKWKLVKTKHELRIYKSRTRAYRDNKDVQPSMISVGRMEGTLEDMIYGSYSKTTEELKATVAYLGIDIRDCAVLHSIEQATPDDPFHYSVIKWNVIQLPGAMIIKPRDWCSLESVGIQRDSQGRRFGYVVLHSVDVPNCPPFDRRFVVRGHGSMTFIYREPTPGVIEIFALGIFDPAGELIQQFTTIMTSEMLSGTFMTVKCAEAKKLTLLAMRNARLPSQTPLQKSCHICHSSGGRFSSFLKICHICCATACAKCRVKKTIFVGPKRSVVKVSCCQGCVMRAKSMEVRPAEAAFSILTEKHIPQEAVNPDESSDSPDEPTPHHEREEDLEGHELDDEGYPLSGMSEADVERMIEAMVGQRLNDSRGAPKSTSSSSSSSRSRSGVQAFEDTTPTAKQQQRNAVPLAVVPDGAYATRIPNDEMGAMTPEQAAMYKQMLALQNAAHHVYAITQANQEMMKKL